jgi:hypothetical protein
MKKSAPMKTVPTPVKTKRVAIDMATQRTAADDLLSISAPSNPGSGDSAAKTTAKVACTRSEAMASKVNGASSADSGIPKATTSHSHGSDVFFHPPKGKYLVPDNRGIWIPQNKDDTAEFLVGRRGFRIVKVCAGALDPVGEELLRIRIEQDVDYAEALAGHRRGFYPNLNGKRVLVTDEPRIIEPTLGEWPKVRCIIEGLLADRDYPQTTYFHAWVRDTYVCLRSARWRPGQILGLLGPRSIGKGLMQSVVTKITGGRETSPYAYLSGKTTFNGELFMAEHLKIEDEAASTDLRARRQFGNGLKQIAANRVHKLHDKYCRGIDLPVFWRCTLSLNNEPENVLILPPMDESMEDKFILFKCSAFTLPMPTETCEQEDELWKVIMDELPHYIYWLLHEFTLPEDLKSSRYAVRHFHHPEVIAALNELAPEEKLLQLVDSCRRLLRSGPEWTGKAAELESLLTAEGSGCEFEARRLFLTQASCGQYLARLAKRYPHRVMESNRVHNTVIWKIHPIPNDGITNETDL